MWVSLIQSLKALAKRLTFPEGGNSARRLSSDSNCNFLWISSLLAYSEDFGLANLCSHMSQFFKIRLSLYPHGGLVAKLCTTLSTSWTVVCQAPLFMGFSRQEYCSGYTFPSPGDLPDTGIEPGSPALQADSYWLSCYCYPYIHIYISTVYKIHIYTHTLYWFCFSGEPWLIWSSTRGLSLEPTHTRCHRSKDTWPVDTAHWSACSVAKGFAFISRAEHTWGWSGTNTGVFRLADLEMI